MSLLMMCLPMFVVALGVEVLQRMLIAVWKVWLIQMSGYRVKIAGRFKPCANVGHFDLETFVKFKKPSRKMQDYGDVNEIYIKPDGPWRVKNEHELTHLAEWHSSGGALYVVDREVEPVLKNSEITQEVLSEENNGLPLALIDNEEDAFTTHTYELIEHSQPVKPNTANSTGQSGLDSLVMNYGTDSD